MERLRIPEHLEFGLKGDRDYVQGTEIYAACRDLLAAPNDARIESLIFHQLLRGDAWIRPLDEIDKTESVAEVRLSTDGRDDWFGLVPAGPPSMPPREFAEDRIVAATEIGESTISLEPETGFDSIEEIVAMVKAWHLRHLPDAVKWLFVRLDHRAGEDLPSSRRGSIQGRLAGRLGSRMTRFMVEVDGCESLITFGSRR